MALASTMYDQHRYRVALAVPDPAQSDPALADLRAVLERHQFWPILAAETADAVVEHQPDLVLLHADSPSSAGIAVCRTLKQAAVVSPPVVLLIPGNGRRKVQFFDELVAASGADDALPIPLRDVDMMHLTIFMQLKQQVAHTQEQNRQLQEQLAERDAHLRQALRGTRELSVLKDSIVNNVSHELRTPLLQVKSAVAMLDTEVKANRHLTDMARLMEFATQATSRLESVIQNITQLAASLSLKVEPMRVQDSVNMAIRQLGRQWAVSDDINRVKQQLNNVPPVLGDKSGIAQVLQQLIDNAIKFSPNGRDVEITAAEHPKDNTVCIAVTDHGIGVEQDQIERIFQEFYQVDQGTKRRFGGAGTGLAIVKLILDNMGISIQVKSKLGEGSTFSFALPKADLWKS